MSAREQPIVTRLLCDLIGATSAYETFSKGDGLKKSRVKDWKQTIAAAKKHRRKTVSDDTLTDLDREITWHALNMRANYIETGDVNLSHRDVVAMMKSKESRERHATKLKNLQPEQEKLVRRLRLLARRFNP